MFAFRFGDSRQEGEILEIAFGTLFGFEVFRTIYDQGLQGASLLTLSECEEIKNEVSSSIDVLATALNVELKRACEGLDVRQIVPFSVSMRKDGDGKTALLLCYDHISVDPIAIGIVHEAIRARLDGESPPRSVDVSEVAIERAQHRATEQYREMARRSGANFVWDESMSALRAIGARDRIERIEPTNGSEVRLGLERWASIWRDASKSHVLPSMLLLYHLARAITELGAQRFMPIVVSTTGRLTRDELRAVSWLSDRVIVRIDGSGGQTPSEIQTQFLNEVENRVSFCDVIEFVDDGYFG